MTSQKVNPEETHGLEERLAQLERRVEERTQSRRKRQMLTLVVGGGLALVCAFVLFRLSVQSRDLTADAMVQIARTQMEPELPGARATMEEHLIREAPTVVRNTMQSVLDTLPSLRVHLTRSFSKRFDQVNEKFESRVRDLMVIAIHESKANLDRQYPDRSDREKLELLGEEVAKRLKKTTDDALDALYPEYTAEMRRLREDIERLYTENPEHMSREDQIKRDLLQTMVLLAKRDGGVATALDIQAAAAFDHRK